MAERPGTYTLRDRLQPTRLLSLTFDQPLGDRVEEGGYHLDFRVKAAGEPVWPPEELGALPNDRWNLPAKLWVVICQWGLGANERFVRAQDERWLAAARGCGEHVLASMRDGGPLDGALEHPFDYPHTFKLKAGWVSAMAQAEAASLLTRLHAATGEEAFAAAAARLLGPIFVPARDGGCGIEWRGGWWPEEYPTDPPSLVLNGGLFALLGMHDVDEATGDERARTALAAGVDLVAANLDAWDLGWWSLYDLYPHARPNVASRAYQELHENLLLALHRCVPRDEFAAYARRFGAQRRSPVANARAFAAKVAFRAVVPR